MMASRRPSLAVPGRDSNHSSVDGRRRSSVRLSQGQIEELKCAEEDDAQDEGDGNDRRHEDSDEGQDEEEDLYQMDPQTAETSPDYWQIHKMVKYLKAGNATCTAVALVGLKDCGLHQEVCQVALKMVGGLEVLLNILRTSNLRCNIGALQVLEAACGHVTTRATVYKLGGLQVLQGLVGHNSVEVKGLAASVLAQVCALSTARSALIRDDGIPKLVSLLRGDPSALCNDSEMGAAVEGAARALWACSVSRAGRNALLRAGGLELMGQLLCIQKTSLLIPVVGVIHQCLTETAFRERVEQAGYTSALVKLLHSPSKQLQVLATKAIARCSVLETTSNRLVKEGGLEVLVNLLKQEAEPYTKAIIEKDPAFARDTGLVSDVPGGAVNLSRKASMMPDAGAAAGQVQDQLPPKESEDNAGQPEGQDQDEDTDEGDDMVQKEEESHLQLHQKEAKEIPGPAAAEAPDKEALAHARPDASQTPFHNKASFDENIYKVKTDPESTSCELDINSIQNVSLVDRMETAGGGIGGSGGGGGGEGTTVGDSELLEAVSEAIWHVSMIPEHVPALKDLTTVPVLVALLHHDDEKVLTNVVGALGEASCDQECCMILLRGGGVTTLIQLLRRTSDKLLLNVTRALGSCAADNDALDALLQQDGLRLLWSHLKNPNCRVQASAANAICTCLQRETEELAEVVRSLVGGIELLVSLLESDSEAVLSAVCAAIAKIAQDPQNLAIMTDYGAVTSLSKLAVRENDSLRPYLAEAIAACCVSRETGLLFGQAGAVAPLVQYLETDDSKIRRPTCRALHRLSLEPENCVTLHQSGAVPLLLEMLGSEDEVVQEAAADCLRNIRLLALQRCKIQTRSARSTPRGNHSARR
ncbi:outer dynein arm-docking complex subunit 2-like [Macrobrachium nipponense]|uniref:outer dynein arm-docking complex subunit 2-like n=1 Tax=Macrobrachium nipponense TaxID=159736 RepID=UPI0030C8989A